MFNQLELYKKNESKEEIVRMSSPSKEQIVKLPKELRIKVIDEVARSMQRGERLTIRRIFVEALAKRYGMKVVS